MKNNDLINCYCTYKWNYKSIDKKFKKCCINWEKEKQK